MLFAITSSKRKYNISVIVSRIYVETGTVGAGIATCDCSAWGMSAATRAASVTPIYCSDYGPS